MRRGLLFLCVLAIVISTGSVAHAFFNPANFWCEGFGSTGSDGANSVAVDASGNIYVIGYFTGTVSFGGPALVSAGGPDVFLVKYSASGAHVWSQRFGSSANDNGTAVAVDAFGNVGITGTFGNTINFGGSTFNTTGILDLFVARFNTNGQHLFSQKYGAGNSDYGLSVAFDASSNLLVTGQFDFTVDFGGGNRVSAGGADIFVAKYNSTGVHQWSSSFGGASFDVGQDVAVDGSGNVFVTGYIQNTVNFGGGNLVSAGLADIFMAKFNSSGVHQWSQRFGGTSQEWGRSIAVNTAGTSVAITGNFQSNPINFGGSDQGNAGSQDVFVARYNGSGVHQWSRQLGGTSSDDGLSVALDASGNVVCAGTFFSTAAYFGGQLFNSAGGDFFLGKYDVNGTHVWSGAFGGVGGTDDAKAIALDASGNVVVAGNFTAVADFGGNELVSAGGTDTFIAKYGAIAGDPYPFITSIDDVGNDQGRTVKIRFVRSGGDDPGAWMNPVTRYVVIRRDDAAPALTTGGKILDSGWTEVGSVSAFGKTSYGIDVPTIGDSTVALGQYYSVFKVRAATNKPAVYFTSEPDSGWSVDNLAPGIPQNFVYESGGLEWDESNAADFDFFTVYGSNTDAFGASVVVDYSVAPTLDVSGSPYVYYFVTATDFSGNEGKPAKVNSLSGVGGTPKSYVLSVSNYPNPFNPRTTVSYTVPSNGRVTISIYDARGERVATLLNGDRSAGAYTIGWDGRNQSGTPVSTGVYLARIEHNGAMRTKKMVLLK